MWSEVFITDLLHSTIDDYWSGAEHQSLPYRLYNVMNALRTCRLPLWHCPVTTYTSNKLIHIPTNSFTLSWLTAFICVKTSQYNSLEYNTIQQSFLLSFLYNNSDRRHSMRRSVNVQQYIVANCHHEFLPNKFLPYCIFSTLTPCDRPKHYKTLLLNQNYSTVISVVSITIWSVTAIQVDL